MSKNQPLVFKKPIKPIFSLVFHTFIFFYRTLINNNDGLKINIWLFPPWKKNIAMCESCNLLQELCNIFFCKVDDLCIDTVFEQ